MIAWEIGRAIRQIEGVRVTLPMFRERADYRSWMAGVPRYVLPLRQKERLLPERRARLISLLGDCCGWCGNSRCYLEIDHIVPAVFGGSLAFENAQYLCHRCNVVRWRERFQPIRDALVRAGIVDGMVAA